MTEQAPRHPIPGFWQFLEDLRGGDDRRASSERRSADRRRTDRPPGRDRRSIERRAAADRRRRVFETFDEGDVVEIRQMLLDRHSALCPRCNARLLRAAGGNYRTIVVCTGCHARVELQAEE